MSTLKTREYVQELLTNGISSATLQTELATSSNLTSFLAIFRSSQPTITFKVLSDIKALGIISGSVLAANNTIYRNAFLAQTLTGSTSDGMLLKVDGITKTIHSLSNLNTLARRITGAASNYTYASMNAGLAYNKLVILLSNSTAASSELFSTSFSTGTFGKEADSTHPVENDHSGNVSSIGTAYFASGQTGTSESSAISAFCYSSSVRYTITSTLTAVRADQTGYQSVLKGFFAAGTDSGDAATNDIDVLLKTNETVTQLLNVLGVNLHSCGSTESDTKGYFFGGNNGTTDQTPIYSHVFSTDTVADTGNDLSVANANPVGSRQSASALIWGGGADAGVGYDFSFSTETVSANSCNLGFALDCASYGM